MVRHPTALVRGSHHLHMVRVDVGRTVRHRSRLLVGLVAVGSDLASVLVRYWSPGQ